MVDREMIRAIILGMYAHRVEQIYGSEGSRALRELLVAINIAHREIPYEIITEGMTIIAPLVPDAELLERDDWTDVEPSELAARFQAGATIQTLPNGRLRFWSGVETNLSPLAETGVVYHYDKADFFFLDGALEEVPNATGYPSAFGSPTFFDLEHALHFYADALARRSTCQILKTCWDDEQRVLLVNRPESIMRGSLAQHLRSSLRNHELVEVREEQNVDESHPVDIKVAWSRSNRIAIIEIKWLGYSVSKDRTHISMTYREGRAQDGAIQLANYLESNHERVPMHITIGYLIVFDARRDGISGNTMGQVVSHQQAEHFANTEISYAPRYDLLRSDFAVPQRIYLAPKNMNVAS